MRTKRNVTAFLAAQKSHFFLFDINHFSLRDRNRCCSGSPMHQVDFAQASGMFGDPALLPK
jgi:hypothetical protein